MFCTRVVTHLTNENNLAGGIFLPQSRAKTIEKAIELATQDDKIASYKILYKNDVVAFIEATYLVDTKMYPRGFKIFATVERIPK